MPKVDKPLTRGQREARKQSQLLSGWVEREIEIARKSWDALTPEERERKVARVLIDEFSPIKAVIPGGKKD